MPTLATTVDGLKLPNPFVIGSGSARDESERHHARVPRRLGRSYCENRQPRFIESGQRHAALRQNAFGRSARK